MFKNLLIPTDGSEFSEKAVKDGITFAKIFGAKVTGVHVTSPVFILPPDDITGYDAKLLRETQEANRKAGQRYLKRIETAAKAENLAFDSVLIEEKPAWEGIIDAARKQNSDLIVMAAHGRSGVKALVLGSVTNKVLTHSKIPVLVYR